MEEIKQAVIDYIKRINTAYAIMINGLWGSGKTYFWNTELRPAIETVQGGSGLLKTVYVSLYGISSTDEISQKIVYGIYAAKISAKTKKRFQGDIMPEIGKVILNVGAAIGGKTEKFLNEGSKVLDSIDKLFNIKKDIVLCFDDVERASMDVHLIMGYINNLVEHDNIKAIIIGNENEIFNRTSNQNQELKSISSTLLLWSEDKIDRTQGHERRNNNYNRNEEEKLSNQELLEEYNQKLYGHKNEYKMIKEKLIGKTLTYRANPEKIIENILNRFEQTNYGIFLNQNCSLIQDVFSNSKTNNFRILQHALDDFEVVFNKHFQISLEVEASIKTIVLTDMIHFMLAYSFDFKSGNPAVDNFRLFDDSSDFLSKVLLAHIDKSNEEYKRVSIFKNRYFSLSQGAFFKSIELLVREGTLNIELFASELTQELKAIESQKRPKYYSLLSEHSYKQLSDDEFILTINDTYEKAKNGGIIFNLYYIVFRRFREFVQLGFFNSTSDKIYDDLMAGLDKAKGNARFVNHDELHTQLKMNENEDEDAQLEKIKGKITSINEELWQKLLQKRVDNIFQNLVEGKVKIFLQLLKEQFSSELFFIHLNANEFYLRVVSLSNLEVSLLIKELLNRYESDYDKTKLRDEKPFFDELKLLIVHQFQDTEMTLRKHLFIGFVVQLDTLFVTE